MKHAPRGPLAGIALSALVWTVGTQLWPDQTLVITSFAVAMIGATITFNGQLLKPPTASVKQTGSSNVYDGGDASFSNIAHSAPHRTASRPALSA